MQHDLILGISEIHIVQDHASFQLGIGHGSVLMWVLPGPQVGLCRRLRQLSLLILHCIDQFHIAFICLRFLVHQIEDTAGTGCGVDHKVNLLAYLGNGVGEALVQSYKGDHRTYGYSRHAVDAQNRSDHSHQSVADPSDIGVYRHQQVCIAIGLVGAVSQGLVDLVEIIDGGLLVAEHLYHLLAVHHFLNESVHSTQILLLADVIFAGQLGKIGGDRQHHHGSEDGDDGQRGVQDQHGHQGSRHGQDRVDNLRNALAEHLP